MSMEASSSALDAQCEKISDQRLTFSHADGYGHHGGRVRFPTPPPGGTADAKGNVYANLKHVAERRGNDWKILASQNTFLPPSQ
jgi:hypothetical protein